VGCAGHGDDRRDLARFIGRANHEFQQVHEPLRIREDDERAWIVGRGAEVLGEAGRIAG
jgi:hypothetical protein